MCRFGARFGVDPDKYLDHGSIVIAAITSCTNTSNPSVMLAARILAKKAVEKGLQVNPTGVKTSLAPGSRVVSDKILEEQRVATLSGSAWIPDRGLWLHDVHRQLGSSIDPHFWKDTIVSNDIVAASVLSGNSTLKISVCIRVSRRIS